MSHSKDFWVLRAEVSESSGTNDGGRNTKLAEGYRQEEIDNQFYYYFKYMIILIIIVYFFIKAILKSVLNPMPKHFLAKQVGLSLSFWQDFHFFFLRLSFLSALNACIIIIL